jgi:hypothetical protein
MQQLIFSLALTVSVFSEVLLMSALYISCSFPQEKKFPFAYEPLNAHRHPRPV